MDALYIIILASGFGKRIGEKNPKQLLKINNHPLLYYSLKTASSLSPKEIILTYPPGLPTPFERFLKKYNFRATLIEGGERRQDSVKNAINGIKDEGIVLIHDAARPLASKDLFERVYSATQRYRCVIPVISVPDTVKEVENNLVLKTLNREKLFLSQTPQGFNIALLKKALKKIDPSIDYTDESALLEILGEKVHTLLGERYNLKLTFKEDLDIIKALINLYEK